MKNILLLAFIIVLSSCVGTDSVDDELISMEINLPPDIMASNQSFAMVTNESISLEVMATSDLGGTFVLTDVEWISSNTDVATISSEGVLATVGVGSTQIVASAFGVDSDPLNLNVAGDANELALIDISSAGDKTVLSIGEELQLSGTPVNVLGEELSNISIEWSSSNESVASVTEDGLVTALDNGTVDIAATAQGKSNSITLNIGMATERTGSLEGINGYDFVGDVTLAVGDDGALDLIFADNFDGDNGPGLYVYLSNTRNRVAGGIEVDMLQATSGSQTYEIPGNVELDQFNYVIIYCMPFGVAFGTAELQ